jgi:hypothetical protein
MNNIMFYIFVVFIIVGIFGFIWGTLYMYFLERENKNIKCNSNKKGDNYVI